MKTCSKFFTYAAVAVFALSSCTSEKLKNDELNSGKTVTAHFGAETTDPSSKATLTPKDGETAFDAAWENGDEILISYSFNNQPPTTTTGTWNSNSFDANLSAGKGDWVYKAAYPVPAKDNSVDFGTNRTQKGNAYNSKYDIMIGKASATNAEAGQDDSGNDIIFKMDRQTAIAYFHFTSDLNEAIQSATLTVSGEGAAIANSAASINNFIFDAPVESNLTEINLTFEDGTAPSAKDFQLWFNVLPTIYKSMTLTVETATKKFKIIKSTEGTYEAGKLYKVKKDGITWTDKVVIDVITASGFTATNTTYTDFSGVKFSSNAVYAGQSAKSKDGAIQLRSKNSNSGIVTTASGGNVRKITINTASGTNTIDIYGKATPYVSATNLYATENGDQGTKLGSLKCGTDTELVIEGDYPYVGIRANDGAVYLTSITITWESGSSEPAPDTYSVTCATVTGGTLSATPSQAEAGAEVTLTATPDKDYEFKNDWIVTNAETSETITVNDGKFTMPAANVTVSASFTPKEAEEEEAVVKTYQHVFTTKPSTGNNVTLSGVSWNITAKNLKDYNSGNYAGVQFGTSSTNGQITLTSPSAWSYTADGVTVTKIKEVRLWLNLGGTSVTPSVTIGGTAATSDGTTVIKNSSAGKDWTKATKVTFTPATGRDTGVIVIDVTSVKAGYICAIEIDAE